MAGLRITEKELRVLLVDRLEIINTSEFDKALAMATRLGIPLELALVERGRIPLGFLLGQIAQAWNVGFKELKTSDVDPAALKLVPEEFARKHGLMPFAVLDGRVQVAMTDPRDRRLLDDIERLAGHKVTPWLAPDGAIRRAHLLYRGDLRALLQRSVTERAANTGDADTTVAEILDRILEYAVVTRASDIHIEPYEREALVRCRIDGVLREVLTVPAAMLPALVTRIKILGGMRIDERRAPQDGRFTADLGGFTVDLRLASLPTHWGEKIVLRLLSRETILLDLEDLGLSQRDYATLLRNILRPFGMVLVTGPTGSGKSTTLYAVLMRLGVERQNVVNISTIEDPIEYPLPRVSQVAVNPAAGVEFASGLRALLRQDPDIIIMVGEIRDRDTADVAVRAALVGRLLLSTLHTNDSTGAIPRLLDMGVEPFLLATTLSFVMTQRLVRRICTSCRESVTATSMSLAALRARPDFEQTVAVLQEEGVLGTAADPLAGVRLFRGKGCAQCGDSGFRGRVGLFELFEVDDATRSMIMEGRPASELRAAAIRRGMKTMLQDGFAKVLLGETTLEEVFRAAL